jgi:hypothetical protein
MHWQYLFSYGYFVNVQDDETSTVDEFKGRKYKTIYFGLSKLKKIMDSQVLKTIYPMIKYGNFLMIIESKESLGYQSFIKLGRHMVVGIVIFHI